MSRTNLVTVSYYLTGGVFSAVVAAKTHFGVLFLAFALPILYLAHLLWNATQRRSNSQSAQVCVTCKRNIGLIRRLSNDRFCSSEHQTQWFDELEKAAIERLLIDRVAETAPAPLKPIASRRNDRDDTDLALALANR